MGHQTDQHSHYRSIWWNEWGKRGRKFKEIMAENFPYLGKDVQIQEFQRFPKKINPKTNTKTHQKLKTENFLKYQEKNNLLCTENYHKTISRYFSSNFADQKERHDILKVLKGKEKNCQQRMYYWAKLFFITEGKIKISQTNKR